MCHSFRNTLFTTTSGQTACSDMTRTFDWSTLLMLCSTEEASSRKAACKLHISNQTHAAQRATHTHTHHQLDEVKHDRHPFGASRSWVECAWRMWAQIGCIWLNKIRVQRSGMKTRICFKGRNKRSSSYKTCKQIFSLSSGCKDKWKTNRKSVVEPQLDLRQSHFTKCFQPPTDFWVLLILSNLSYSDNETPEIDNLRK